MQTISQTAVSPVNLHNAARCGCRPFFSYFFTQHLPSTAGPACPPFFPPHPSLHSLNRNRLDRATTLIFSNGFTPLSDETRHQMITAGAACAWLWAPAVGLKVGVCEVFGAQVTVEGSVHSDAWSSGICADMHNY